MAPRSNRGLSIESTMYEQSQKYLGETHDPHFIPSSPLIDRPIFSAEDELELKRACTLALARVPHSDEMADDPFRYLGKHILVKTQTRTKEVSNNKSRFRERAPEPLTNVTTRQATAYDTATPSETSKRETLQTNGSTPLTTPGLSPEESGKRFSDAMRMATTISSSNLKTEAKPVKNATIYSFLKSPLSKSRPQPPVATKSLTHLPMTATNSVQRPSEPSRTRRSEPLGTPNFNKSLPALPRPPTNASERGAANTEKPGVFSRLFKTKTAQPQQTQPTVKVQIRAAAPQAARPFEEDDTNVESHSKRKRFNITAIFNKPNAAYPKRATVG